MTPEQLVKRYLDPRARWTAADETQAKAVKADPEARRIWARAIAVHRAMVGARDLPSGIEQRRQLELALPTVTRSAFQTWWVPLTSLAVALLIAMPALLRTEPVERAEWIKARGIHGNLEPQVGLGIGGVTEDGREYEAIADAMYVDDWLRLSYTNARSDLTWLYVFAIQGARVIPIAPLDEGQSLPIHVGRFVPLAFETRLGARHQLGPVRIVALFTVTPVTTTHVAALVLDPSLVGALPSELEVRLRVDLALPPEAVVRVLDSHIRPGSATLPGARQETP